MEFALPSGHLIDFASRLIRVSAINVLVGKVTERLRKSVCRFQLEYTNYHFMASQLHKEFKKKFTENPKDSTAEYDKLVALVETGFKKLCGDVAASIQNYFQETHVSNIAPRVGIHFVTKESEIIDIILLPTPVGYESAPKQMEDYTVFLEVINTGKPYLDNNIPKTVRNDKAYKHRGLNVERVRTEYHPRWRDKKLLSRWRNSKKSLAATDADWKAMASGNTDHSGTLYKSHLIIPITFRRHAEKAALAERMVEILQLNEEGRSILGFVFVDHSETYYFEDKPESTYDNSDVNSMYLYADLLSLVLVSRLMYGECSKTVKNYRDSIGG